MEAPSQASSTWPHWIHDPGHPLLPTVDLDRFLTACTDPWAQDVTAGSDGIVAQAYATFELYNTWAAIMNVGEPPAREERLDFELARRSVADALQALIAPAETVGSDTALLIGEVSGALITCMPEVRPPMVAFTDERNIIDFPELDKLLAWVDDDVAKDVRSRLDGYVVMCRLLHQNRGPRTERQLSEEIRCHLDDTSAHLARHASRNGSSAHALRLIRSGIACLHPRKDRGYGQGYRATGRYTYSNGYSNTFEDKPEGPVAGPEPADD